VILKGSLKGPVFEGPWILMMESVENWGKKDISLILDFPGFIME
jgi:hypothetical protein